MSDRPTSAGLASPQRGVGKWLDPRDVEALGGVGLRMRAVVEGVIAGLHRSPHKGASVEFAEYKEYAPGDEIRHIDWRAYGRIDRYIVKQFEDETNVRAILALDASGSMAFAFEDAPTKLAYASTLVASLAYLLQRQGDAPGVLLFDERPGFWLPPSSKGRQLDDICAVLDTAPGAGRTSTAAALTRIAERLRSRSFVVLLSDLLDTTDEMLTLAKVLRRRGTEVVLLHVLDRAEWTLPYEGLTLFEGCEGEDDLLVDPDDIRSAYQEQMRAHVGDIEDACHKGDIEYYRAFTDEPHARVLLELLTARRRRR